jgi:endonuclease G
MAKWDQFQRLKRYNAWVDLTDSKRTEESFESVIPGEAAEEGAVPDVDAAIFEESIVLRRLRPVLAIKNNEPQFRFDDPADGQLWEARLRAAAPSLTTAAGAIGRIDLQKGPLEWVGTGWLVDEDIVVTNRHVAEVFGKRNGEGFSFRPGDGGGEMESSLNFRQEIDNAEDIIFKLVKVLHIEPRPGPDIAFLKISRNNGAGNKLASPIALSSCPAVTEDAAVIGYPAYDSRIPEPELMERIYGKVYNKKRLAPGGVTRVDKLKILHNCTTLGGNSGSAVLDLKSSKAVGLHFSGSFLASNYAVRSDVVGDLLNRVRAGGPKPERPSRGPAPTPTSRPPPVAATPRNPVRRDTVSVTIPLTVTVSLGRPPEASPAARSDEPAETEDQHEIGEETVASDYRGRGGYDRDFLGVQNSIPLPEVQRDKSDVLEFDLEGAAGSELRYEHFSVVMSRSRRMCFFSGVNIDGKKSKKSTRARWKWDPRIRRTQQIMGECYGSPPKFSRGHMTRREDPVWGSDTIAERGNQDSMHVTNVTPQMQAFNAPIWLALEDYALQHAREDEMKISVFTGPYLRKSDPTMYKVKIPVSFWKIIVFIHDDTGELCATGYEMTQKQSMEEEEFVFGAFTSKQLNVATQVSIRSIETKSGISFGRLASIDPLVGDEEGFADDRARLPLDTLEQIRFVS